MGTALKVERFIKNQDRKTKLLWIESPGELKSKVSKNMGKELIIFPFDASRVEKESGKMDWRKIKNGYDPFAETPISSLEAVKGV